jgi:hypothetical protein
MGGVSLGYGIQFLLHVEGAGIKGELARQNIDGYKQADLA